jgi:adenosine deaminase
MNNNISAISWYEKVPKVELHIHLTGSIPLETLWELISKYGGDPDIPDIAALERKFRYRDFPHFLDTWRWKNGFLREYEDFTFLSEAVARDLARQNILYAEVSFSLARFQEHDLETQRLAESIRSGLSKVPEIEIALIVDQVRDYGPDLALQNLDDIVETREFGIIGVDIGGSEADFPPELFVESYQKARTLGFHTRAHAGEGAGPESVWGAINSLKVDRIGHGTRAIEDEKLVDYLSERRIPVEICLLSNMRTGVVESAEAHPVRHYFEKGIPLSINTDDPKMFNNSLAEEYETLETVLGFTRDEIRSLIFSGVNTSWLPEDRKRELKEKLTGHPGWMD